MELFDHIHFTYPAKGTAKRDDPKIPIWGDYPVVGVELGYIQPQHRSSTYEIFDLEGQWLATGHKSMKEAEDWCLKKWGAPGVQRG